MKLGEFFVQLSVQAETTKVKDFAREIEELPLKTAGAIAALVKIALVLKDMGEQAINTAVGFQMFSSQTGLSAQELHKWQIVAERANVSTEAVASSIMGLERNMAEIRLGRGNISPFQMLGIGVNQDAFHVLNQLRERIRGLDRPTSVNLMAQMGIDPQMIQLLTLSDDKFSHFTKTIHAMTPIQEEAFLKMKENMVGLKQVFRTLTVDFLSHFIFYFNLAASAIQKFSSHIPLLIGVIGALALTFQPLIAGIVLLVLILDDLAVYFQGGDSLIGKIINGFKGMSGAAQGAASSTSKALQNIFSGNVLGPLAPFAAMFAPGILGAQGSVGKASGNVFHITVSGNTDATTIAQHVIEEIQRTLGYAEQQTNNQGR